MDTVETVARCIVANARYVGGHIGSATTHRVAARQVADERSKVGHVHNRWIHNEGGFTRLVEFASCSEQAKRIATGKRQRPQGKTSPLQTAGLDSPGMHPSSTQRMNDPAHLVFRQSRMIPHLQPKLGNRTPVLDHQPLLCQPAHLGPAGPGMTLHPNPAHAAPRP